MARVITGRVSSDKPNKSIVVTVTSRQTHPLYKKQFTRNTKFMAHDEKNQAKVGDIVSIIESAPMSSRKRFKLDKIIESSSLVYQESDSEAGVVIPKKQKTANEPKVVKLPEAKSGSEPKAKAEKAK